MKKQSEENLVRGRKIYEPPRFMTVSQASKQVLSSLDVSDEATKGMFFIFISYLTYLIIALLPDLVTPNQDLIGALFQVFLPLHLIQMNALTRLGWA